MFRSTKPIPCIISIEFDRVFWSVDPNMPTMKRASSFRVDDGRFAIKLLEFIYLG